MTDSLTNAIGVPEVTPIKNLDELGKMSIGTKVRIIRTRDQNEEVIAALHKVRYKHGAREDVFELDFIFPGDRGGAESKVWGIEIFPEYNIWGFYDGAIYADYACYFNMEMKDDVRETLRIAGF